jgi:hypothetical protein
VDSLTVAEPVRLTRWLWVARWIPFNELVDVMGSDLDAEADERFGVARWQRNKVSVEYCRFPPAEAPTPPTTVNADLFLGWAYYLEVTRWSTRITGTSGP